MLLIDNYSRLADLTTVKIVTKNIIVPYFQSAPPTVPPCLVTIVPLQRFFEKALVLILFRMLSGITLDLVGDFLISALLISHGGQGRSRPFRASYHQVKSGLVSSSSEKTGLPSPYLDGNQLFHTGILLSAHPRIHFF